MKNLTSLKNGRQINNWVYSNIKDIYWITKIYTNYINSQIVKEENTMERFKWFLTEGKFKDEEFRHR